MRRWCERDEELAAVRILASIGHGQRSFAFVLERWNDLILELAAVDRFSTAAGTGGVAALNHEAFDDAVEDYAIVFSGLRKGCKVLARSRSLVRIQLDRDIL